MDLPSRVGWLSIFGLFVLSCFVWSGSKSDPKNIKISKKKKKKWHFFPKTFGKYFDLFSKKIVPKFEDFGKKAADFKRFWKK